MYIIACAVRYQPCEIMWLCVRSHDSHVMLPRRFGKHGGSLIQNFVCYRFDECHGDQADGIRLRKFLHHHRNLDKVSVERPAELECKKDNSATIPAKNIGPGFLQKKKIKSKIAWKSGIYSNFECSNKSSQF